MNMHHLFYQITRQSLLTLMLMGACIGTANAQDAVKPEANTQDAAKPANADDKSAKSNHTMGKHFASLSDMIRKSMPEAAAQAQKAADAQKKGGTIDPDARQYVDAIQNYYDNAKTYSAAFEQDYETVDGVKKKSTGTVWFKKPGMMRWDYETPEARFIISDNESLWTWEPVYRQFCKQMLRASQLPSALSFLTGTGKIEDDFSVKLAKVNGNQVQLALTPIQPSLAYESILFEILMPSAKVYRATIYDAMGNFNRITFKSPELNAELDDNSFRFNPPADAKHICE